MADILARGECFDLSGLAADGKMLLSAGVPKGKELGNILDRLLSEVIDGTLENESDRLVSRALELSAQNQIKD